MATVEGGVQDGLFLEGILMELCDSGSINLSET